MFFLGTAPTILAVIVMLLIALRFSGVLFGVAVGVILIFLPKYASTIVFGFMVALILFASVDAIFGAFRSIEPWVYMAEPKRHCLKNRLYCFLTKLLDHVGSISCVGFYFSMGLAAVNLFFSETSSKDLTLSGSEAFYVYAYTWDITLFATILFFFLVFVRYLVSLGIKNNTKRLRLYRDRARSPFNVVRLERR